MKRIFSILTCLVAAFTLIQAAQVTIDARDLKLYEQTAGFPLYILRMDASSSTAQIRIQIRATAEDYTGTYAIDGSDNSALVLPAGASYEQATQAVSGNIVITRPNGDAVVTGSIVCTNGVTYILNLRIDPQPTRNEVLTINTLTLEDRTLSEQEFQIYGFNDDSTKYVQITVFTSMLEGTFTTNNIYKDFSYIRIQSTSTYHNVLTGNFSVRKSGSNRVAVTGTLICQNENDATDIIGYTIAFSCLRDKKNQPMSGDATDADFEATFDDYTLDISEQAINGDIFVYARNTSGQCIALDVYIADGETDITAGTYPILQGTDLSNPYMSVHASEGIISGFITPSYAGYVSADNQLQSPVWYIMAGSVIVDEAGNIEVTAINSAERLIHCILHGKTQDLCTPNEQDTRCRKIIRGGQLLILRDDKTYTLQGLEVQ